MQSIEAIIMHCSATREGRPFTAKDIDSWHRARGFSKIGYHYVVDLDGTIEKGREEHEDGAHCTQERMNHRSIGICYIGGLDENGMPKDTRTEAQKASLRRLVENIRQRYGWNVEVFGHRDFAAKACPCFDARHEYGIDQGKSKR